LRDAREVSPRGFGTRRGWNVRQRLQQPVHRLAARKRRAPFGAAIRGGAGKLGVIVGARWRDWHDLRQLSRRVAIEPGWARAGSDYRSRYCRGDRLGGLRRPLAIAPDVAVAIIGGLLHRGRRLQGYEHEVVPAAFRL